MVRVVNSGTTPAVVVVNISTGGSVLAPDSGLPPSPPPQLAASSSLAESLAPSSWLAGCQNIQVWEIAAGVAGLQGTGA